MKHISILPAPVDNYIRLIGIKFIRAREDATAPDSLLRLASVSLYLWFCEIKYIRSWILKLPKP